jgi:hypothetical protein
LARVKGGPAPRREFGDPAIGPVVDELGEDIGQICFRIDVVQLAALDQRGQHRPVFRAFVAAGEQSILSAESNREFVGKTPRARAIRDPDHFT